MKKIFLILFFLINSIISYGTEKDYKVIEYDIYPYKAKLTFETTVNKEKVIKLPNTFSADSVILIPEEGLNITEFKVYTKFAEDIIPEHLQDDKETIRLLEKDLDYLNSEVEAIDQSILILENNSTDKLTFQELTKYIKNSENLRKKLAKELAEKERKLNLMEKKLENLRNRYNDNLPKNINQEVYIVIKSSNTGNVKFEAWTDNVEWQPIYDMELDSKSGLISLKMYANIKQYSILNWSGKMNFHTKMPTINNNNKLNHLL